MKEFYEVYKGKAYTCRSTVDADDLLQYERTSQYDATTDKWWPLDAEAFTTPEKLAFDKSRFPETKKEVLQLLLIFHNAQRISEVMRCKKLKEVLKSLK